MALNGENSVMAYEIMAAEIINERKWHENVKISKASVA